MGEDSGLEAPAGFRKVPEGLGFNDILQPFFMRREGDCARLGMWVQPHHANTIGVCHGGVLMTFADVAAAAGANLARRPTARSPSINLSIDFVGAARVGDWIEAENQTVETRRRFGFASGVIRGPQGVVARYNATLYFPEHEGLVTEQASGGAQPGLWFEEGHNG